MEYGPLPPGGGWVPSNHRPQAQIMVALATLNQCAWTVEAMLGNGTDCMDTSRCALMSHHYGTKKHVLVMCPVHLCSCLGFQKALSKCLLLLQFPFHSCSKWSCMDFNCAGFLVLGCRVLEPSHLPMLNMQNEEDVNCGIGLCATHHPVCLIVR